METFGEKLRLAIEASDLPLDEIARRTGLEPEELEALARDDLARLPDDAATTSKIRVFAELMGVDAEEVIEDYGHARAASLPRAGASPVADTLPLGATELWRESPEGGPSAAERSSTLPWSDDLEPDLSTELEAPPSAWTREAPPVPEGLPPAAVDSLPRPSHHDRKRRPIWIAVGVIALAGAGFVLFRTAEQAPLLNRNPAPPTIPATATPAATEVQPVAPVPSPAPAPTVETTATEADATPADRVSPEPPREQDGTGVTVGAHGVGTGVANHVLIGESGQFPAGTKVWFFTDVRGAGTGETIEHVWLHHGQEELRVPLRIGGERWRTQSYKTLRAGSEGDWVVEARDEEGRVLARSSFRCLPA